ncbi:LysE family translocator [Desertibaculum subflavum]|uniref:LysE family translocator n=1 Tax=Desertibaculum subflavum TaxID=2268458 RepID=UPI000E66DEEC
MMSLELYFLFVTAATLLILTPGPNVSLIVGNSISHGTRLGLFTVGGTTTATVLQIALVVGGMTSLLALASDAFDWIRWAGVAYLIYLGIQQWRAPAALLDEGSRRAVSLRNLFAQGILVAITNPKTLLFHAAFLPQFVDPAVAAGPQLLLLGATYTALAGLLDCGWAWAGGRLRGRLDARRGKLVNRVSGGCIIGAAIGLALARRP